MKEGLIAEATLEAMIRQQVELVKEQYDCWQDPEALCAEMGIRVIRNYIGLGREGAAFAGAIQLDPTAGTPARQRFTFYHEIVHHLLRNHAELYSIMNDQYVTDDHFDAICERLCNVGAAEFLLPRETVRATYRDRGFSVNLIEHLSQSIHVSRVATCAQLAFCAPHQCIALVCRQELLHAPTDPQLPLADVDEQQSAFVISCAFRSSRTKYSCAIGTPISATHLLATMLHAPHGVRVSARAVLPFRSNKHWEVDCECVRLGEQVFAFFHLEQPPTSWVGQLSLW